MIIRKHLSDTMSAISEANEFDPYQEEQRSEIYSDAIIKMQTDGDEIVFLPYPSGQISLSSNKTHQDRLFQKFSLIL